MKFTSASLVAAALAGSVAAAPAAVVFHKRSGSIITPCGTAYIPDDYTGFEQGITLTKGSCCDAREKSSECDTWRRFIGSNSIASNQANTASATSSAAPLVFTATIGGIAYGPSATIGDGISIAPDATSLASNDCELLQDGGINRIGESSPGACQALSSALSALQATGSPDAASATVTSTTAPASTTSTSSSVTPTSTLAPTPTRSASPTVSAAPNGAVAFAAGSSHTLFAAAGAMLGAAWILL